MNELLHARLMPWRPEDVLLVRGLLVELQYHDEQRTRNIIVGTFADTLQGNAKFDSVEKKDKC